MWIRTLGRAGLSRRAKRLSARAKASRRRLRLAVGLLLALLASGALQGQSRSIRFERIAIEQGLSQGTVNCILQDRIGFMWFGTQDGLDRFDGARFEALAHDPEDPASLNDNWILALIEDAGTGDLWVGTRNGGLSRWRRSGSTFSHYRHDPDDPRSLAGDEVRALVQSRDGGIWIGTGTTGLDHLDPETGVIEHYRHDPADPRSLSHDRILTLYEDRAGDLFVGSLGGLDRFDPATDDFTRFFHDAADPGSLSDSRVRSILEDREGNLWIGTYGGLERLDPETGLFERFRHLPDDPSSLAEDRVRALFEDRDGRLWVGTDGALDLFDPVSRSFVHYRHNPAEPHSLSAERVMSIYQDRGGVLWVGMQGGLAKWSPRTWSFSHYKSDPSRPSSLSSDKILSISEDAAGALWLGTNGYGLNRFERSSGKVTRYRSSGQPGSLGSDIVTAVHHDRRGQLWVGTLGGGLSRLDATTDTFETFVHDPEREDSLGANGVMSVYEDRSDNLWIGTYGGGLNRLDRTAGTFERWRHDPADAATISGDKVTALAEDTGFLWVGTFGSGLNRFDPRTGAFLRFAHDRDRASSLTNDAILALHFTREGDLWIGTQIGLNRLERLDEASGEAVFRRYFEAQGLPNEFIYGIYDDSAGRLWLSTNRGLSRFDPRTESFKNFDTSHGLQAYEFNMNAHFQSPIGELFFGGVNGFNAFFPDRIEPDTSVPPVVLTSFSKLNRPVLLERPIFETDEVTLDHCDYIFSFELAALDYAAPGKNQYRYRLEGFNDEWIDLGNRRRVSFTNLDPGAYELLVQGSNSEGIWSENSASIRIRVLPPPWQTRWAYASYLAVLSALVWSYLRAQHRKVERERAVSARLREVDKLKDELLAKMRLVVEERTEQVAEREQLIAEREHLIAELEAKNAELERFNYTVSHDLKSPLVTIKGFLGLLEQDAASGDTERLEHDFDRISAAADKMYNLLEELLELSRVGLQAGPTEEVSLGEIAAEALEMVDGMVTERRVEVDIAPDLPRVLGDRTRLLEVYQNLLTNAMKYMGDQSAPRIDVGLARNGSGGHLYVRDNGIGIEPRYHDKIFGLFERLDAHEEGSGIGLAVVKRIIETHGGNIWVESAGAGKGSTFCFTLRRQQKPLDGESS